MSQTKTPPIYELGPDFYDEVKSADFPQAQLRYRNDQAAKLVGLEALSAEQWQQHFAHFTALPSNLSTPLALRYHGHQFRQYNPDLGDGRGFLFAQFQVGDKLYDLGTKGSGQTPYSRRGDGRLTLKGAFREILATELLESYGVNTSKTFSVFETGESLERHDEPSPTRAGVLVRLSHGHIRFGTFQRLAFLKQIDNIKKLLAYSIRHYYPDLLPYSEPEQAALFLKQVSFASAETVAAWMMAGFVHGVLNTDNMNVTGESFDYGPYRFLPHYDPTFTAAYFDQSGLYCFGRQPSAVLWNVLQLAEALKVAFPDLATGEIQDDFADQFNLHMRNRLLSRLNLYNPLEDEAAAAKLDEALIMNFFNFMDEAKPFYEQTFYDLHSGVLSADQLIRSPQAKAYKHPSFAALEDTLECYEVADQKKAEHSYFQKGKACSLLIDELEGIWAPIAEKDDWTLFEEKLAEIRSFRGVY
ncbi:YdiU family protein [Bdellovibrio sp. PAP01]|uniref:Protein nucleotidyltransferase YdiU n=1 Tax=Bdellovibrio svalbardensis TaxID=2972972 RepID=A0ABT6DQZ9_9BACT|nr:YdiU family protein [Bdellovibrio svalbardensis]MDG0818251.1 YdiU family protein [Bdellovibrio svalbardensis]